MTEGTLGCHGRCIIPFRRASNRDFRRSTNPQADVFAVHGNDRNHDGSIDNQLLGTSSGKYKHGCLLRYGDLRLCFRTLCRCSSHSETVILS